jgi:Glycosyltransferase family 87
MPVRLRSRGGAGKRVPAHDKGNRRPGLNPIGTEAARTLRMNPNRDLRTTCIIALALVALTLKLAIAYNTFGTNDAVTFYSFGKALSENGLEWTYRHSIYFNHPPLAAYYLRAIYLLDHQPFFRDNGLTFPLLLRLPGIIADLITVVALCWMTGQDREVRIPTWALALFALSPVSIMVTGFHGNTDPVMVMLLVLASLFCLRGKSVWCGLFLALSCQIKIIPLLLLPIFLFFWLPRRRAVSFSLPFVSASLVLWAEPLLKFPALFLRNVLSYGSYWGIWGITYWLKLTNLAMFGMVTFYHFPPMQSFVANLLKLIIIGAVLMIAWRRRNLGERALLDSLAYAWIVFFVFAPGVCAQYMVWLAPFVLVLSPVLYGWLVASSSLFLFFFYNVTAGGLPWYGAVSDGRHNSDWVPWSLWPWAVLIAALIIFWKNARQRYPSLHLLSLDALPMRP